MSKEFEEILIEKMNKELDNLVKNASKLKKLTAVSIIGMKQPTILLFLSILSDYKRVLKENEELRKKYNKDTHTLQNQLDIANADRVEKDKIMKLMTKYIADDDTTEIFCDDDKFEIDAFGYEVDCDEDCQECVIRFFEEKVRNKYE